MPTPATLMSITGAPSPIFNDYSVRALTMTLEPITSAAQLVRTINGDLVDLSLEQFHDRYLIAITCTDQESPHFVGNIRPGFGPLTVTCVPQLGEDSTPLVLTNVYVIGWQVGREEYQANTSYTLSLTQ